MVPASLMLSPPGPVTVFDGKEYLYFGGTSYLGLAGHPEVIEAGCEALRRYGVHTATSRSRLGNNPPVVAVEQNAAAFFGTEDAFYFGSGYVANHIMIAALAKDVDAVVLDEAAHYCVLEAARLSNKPLYFLCHRDPKNLHGKIQGMKRVMVMTDSVGPSSGLLAPIEAYIEVLRECEHAYLLLDEAHGFGVLGPNGRGLIDQVGLWDHTNRLDPPSNVSLFACGTLAKALGGFGGIIPGSRDFVQRVRESSHYYDGSSAPASAVAGSTAKALEIVMRTPSLRADLRRNTLQLREGLRALGLAVPPGETANFGVTIGKAANMLRLHEGLKAACIMLPYIGSYTGIPPEGVLRFAVFANHTSEQIGHLLDHLRKLL